MEEGEARGAGAGARLGVLALGARRASIRQRVHAWTDPVCAYRSCAHAGALTCTCSENQYFRGAK